jgi:outer membrane receptor for ferrienterochelin and colicin
VLDTVKVTARRNGSLNMADFQERARTGPGRYLTAADIARRQPIVTSDIFRNVPGVTINGARGSINDSIIVRGALGPCKASIYIDGRLMPSPFTTDDLDAYVRPKEIKGVEVYAGIGAPPQFQEDMGSCGSIVIWTR